MAMVQEEEDCFIAFFPTEAPAYGGDSIEVEFCRDIQLPPEGSIFLVYEGKRVRHVTGVRLVDNGSTLHAIIPEHVCEETVSLSAYVGDDGAPTRRVSSRDAFSYVYDNVCQMALYLARAAGDADALAGARAVKTENFSAAQVLRVPQADEKLAACFRRFDELADDQCSVFTSCDSDTGFEGGQGETLLHVAARLGLQQLATYLLSREGASAAIKQRGSNGCLPQDEALNAGLITLADVLSEYTSGRRQLQSDVTEAASGAVLIRRTRLGTHELSTDTALTSRAIGSVRRAQASGADATTSTFPRQSKTNCGGDGFFSRTGMRATTFGRER
ncbi:PREDICTED: A-kinase anchor protein 13-like [Priapulus caudatus]|uniref:A-kinase anchor protein 13-like n=1 Tax=Priapulus caudatus TaxID=37621 RepID=A0ABM1DU35_PRICU|nr:PREDICTED: A-kinase anchor protein 13-like [Priapulus caudatus]